MKTLKIAFRNLNRQKRRSVLLGIAVAFVFLISVLISGMASGMIQSVEYNIASGVGGHIWILASTKDADVPEDELSNEELMGKEQEELFEDIIKECSLELDGISKRTPIEGAINFAGKKYNTSIWGIYPDEKLAWDSIIYKEGNREAMRQENAITLSETIVDQLNLKLHDIILFETKNNSGQKTVVEFQLEGIAVDSNLLAAAFTVFANIDYIHKIYDADIEDGFGSYFILLKNGKNQDEIANKIEDTFRKRNLLVTNRQLAKKENPNLPMKDLVDQLCLGKWEGYKYAVANMNDVSPGLMYLNQQVQRIAFVVLFVLLALTMIGVLNTFRMIVFERRGEIGTMRACGASARSVKNIFLMEGVLLTFIGAVAGLLLGLLIMFIISLIPIAKDSMFSVFARGGHMVWKLESGAIAFWFLILAVLTLLAVRIPASKGSKMLPAEALRSVK